MDHPATQRSTPLPPQQPVPPALLATAQGQKEEAHKQGKQPLHQATVEDVTARKRHGCGIHLLAPTVKLPMFAFY